MKKQFLLTLFFSFGIFLQAQKLLANVDFEKGNMALAKAQYITHKIYEYTGHGVKDENPKEVLADIHSF